MSVKNFPSVGDFIYSKYVELEKRLSKLEEEDKKFLSNLLFENFQKNIDGSTSANGYVKFRVNVPFRFRKILLKEVECYKWNPQIKTRNCDRSFHYKIVSIGELTKFVPKLYGFEKKVGYNSLWDDSIYCYIRCSIRWPIYIAFNQRNNLMWVFFSVLCQWKKKQITVQPLIELKKGTRRGALENNNQLNLQRILM